MEEKLHLIAYYCITRHRYDTLADLKQLKEKYTIG